MLTLLSYASSVSLTTLRATLHRLLPDECNGSDPNFQRLTVGCVAAWLLLVVAPIPRLMVRISLVVRNVLVGERTPMADEMELQAMTTRSE